MSAYSVGYLEALVNSIGLPSATIASLANRIKYVATDAPPTVMDRREMMRVVHELRTAANELIDVIDAVERPKAAP